MAAGFVDVQTPELTEAQIAMIQKAHKVQEYIQTGKPDYLAEIRERQDLFARLEAAINMDAGNTRERIWKEIRIAIATSSLFTNFVLDLSIREPLLILKDGLRRRFQQINTTLKAVDEHRRKHRANTLSPVPVAI